FQAMRMGLPPVRRLRRRPCFRQAGQKRALLVSIQVAAATCLLAQTGLLYTSMLEAVNGMGFTPGNLVMAEVPNLRKLGHSEASIQQIFDRIEARVRSLPGTLSTGTATSGPYRKFQVTSLRGPDRQLPKVGEGVYLTGVSLGYIESMGMTLAAGRNFMPKDSSGSEKVAILNKRLAQLIWADKNPIGDCVYVSKNTQCRRVVGILDDTRIETSIFAKPKLQCYLPLAQYGGAGLDRAGDYLLVRVADGRVSKTIQQLKAAPGVPYYVYATEVDAFVEEEVRSMTSGAVILGLLSLAAIAVSALGIFAQLAFWVGSRKRELGVRLALGAPPSRMIRTVSGQSAIPVGTGLLFGLLASIPISNLARSYIFGLSAITLDSMMLIALIVLSVGALACAMPCIRALKLDPIETLRTE
ncbi:MAG: FtsX-like permease family protein, partial [Acidobacteriota bacterium]